MNGLTGASQCQLQPREVRREPRPQRRVGREFVADAAERDEMAIARWEHEGNDDRHRAPPGLRKRTKQPSTRALRHQRIRRILKRRRPTTDIEHCAATARIAHDQRIAGRGPLFHGLWGLQ